MKHKTKEPKARLNKRSTAQHIKECLQHAAWHCRYGTDLNNRDREPVLADLEAASLIESVILKAVFNKLLPLKGSDNNAFSS